MVMVCVCTLFSVSYSYPYPKPYYMIRFGGGCLAKLDRKVNITILFGGILTLGFPAH